MLGGSDRLDLPVIICRGAIPGSYRCLGELAHEERMSGLAAILDAIGKYSWRSMFGVFVATGMVLLLSAKLGISDLESPLHGWLILAFVFSGAVLLTYLGSAVYPRIAGHTRDWGITHRGKKHLRQLSNDEKQHCQWFVANDGSSLHHNEANGALGSLIERNILFTPGRPWGNGMRDFRMRPWALAYLKKNPELLK
jgi:Super-infection exclusion protein B